MAGPDSYPPPGADPPLPTPPPANPPAAYPPPGYAPPPPGWAPGPVTYGPGMSGAAHKPGAIPLRPLALGDMYDAAFRIIRFNPRATVGSAVLVAAVAMAIPVLVTSALTWTVDLSLAETDAGSSRAADVRLIGSMASLGLGSILQSVGLVLVTGMIAHVTAAAAVGRRLTLGEAWRATHGKRWRLIGLAALLGLMMLGLIGAYALTWLPVALGGDLAVVAGYGLVTVPLFLALLVWLWIRVFYLPVPALMLEPVGVTGAIGRGFRLTRGQFWRTFGIALLTVVVANVAGSMLSLPATLLGPVVAGGLSPEYALLGLVVTNAFTAVVAAAFSTPFTSAVTSVQYLDQRMRKEAYDVELMARAGIPRS